MLRTSRRLSKGAAIGVQASLAAIGVATAAVATVDADAQCQNQTCAQNGSCFQCGGSGGNGCSVPVGECNTCTSWICPPLPPPTGAGLTDPELKKYWEACHAHSLSVSLNSPLSLGDIRAGVTQLAIMDVDQSQPAKIILVTYGLKDKLFLRGKLVNVSKAPIASYRIGWFIGDSKNNISLHQGSLNHIPRGLAPMMVEDIPAQEAPAEPIRNDQNVIARFFVTEVKYRDGRTWKVNSTKVKAQLRSLLAAHEPISTAVSALERPNQRITLPGLD